VFSLVPRRHPSCLDIETRVLGDLSCLIPSQRPAQLL
jgi:hypothetical protein